MEVLMKRIVTLVAAVVLTVGIVAGIAPTPADAAVDHEPYYPSAYAVCHLTEARMEAASVSEFFKSRWRQFHFGVLHVTQCEFFIVGHYPLKLCVQIVENDGNLYFFNGPSSSACW
jgi:hypothetical protein